MRWCVGVLAGALLPSLDAWQPGGMPMSLHSLRHGRSAVATLEVSMGAAAASDGQYQQYQPPEVSGFFELFERFDRAWSAFDLDGDGTITVDEIGDVLREMGEDPSEAELEAMLSEFDDNGNGTIDFDEFCNLMTTRTPPTEQRGVDAMMRQAANRKLGKKRRSAKE
jgi:hypothetical protein